MSDRFVVLSGCSGGGKSTLLAELRHRGYATVDEPGRRIVQEELATGGAALPWIDPTAFARRAVAVALADRLKTRDRSGWVFFDRGLVDAAAGVEHMTAEPVLDVLGRSHRYHSTVFLVPPWPEIFRSDRERRHEFDVAVAEYERIAQAYLKLSYEVVILPKTGVAERADTVLRRLTAAAASGSIHLPRPLGVGSGRAK